MSQIQMIMAPGLKHVTMSLGNFTLNMYTTSFEGHSWRRCN